MLRKSKHLLINNHFKCKWNKFSKRQSDYVFFKDPIICCLQKLSIKNTHRLKVKSWKKIFYTIGKQKRTGVAILILDKIDVKQKRDKSGHYIMTEFTSSREYNNCEYLCTQHQRI